MQKRLRPGRLAALLLALPVVGACGFNAQTDAVYQPAVGVNARDSQVDVLGAVIVSGERGSGVLITTLSNESTDRSDALESVQGAGSVQVATGQPIEIPPTGAVNLADEDDGPIPVTGSSINPVTSDFVTLRFTFQHAQPVTVGVPVVLPQGPYAAFGPSATRTPNDVASAGSQGSFPTPAG